MAEYLQPTCELDSQKKQKMFEVRNDMVQIPSNYGKQILCLCGNRETMIHIYNCEIWSQKGEKKIPYNDIYNGKIEKQIEILKIFERNLEKRNQAMTLDNSHVILYGSAVKPVTMG